MEKIPDVAMSHQQRKILIVFAHPDKRSFNGALLHTAVQTLEREGHEVVVSDLHEQNFDPRAKRDDVLNEDDSDVSFNYNDESRKAYQTGKLSAERTSEMSKLASADLVIFQCPIFWSSVPGILKGWLDKVLVDGFAFDFERGNILDKGLMKGKRAVLSMTTGCGKSALSPFGINGDINVLLCHIQYGTLRMCGFDVLRPQLSYETTLVSEETRKEYLRNWENRLVNIFEEPPLIFPSVSDFDTEKTMTLTHESIRRYNSSGTIPSPAHHLGKLDTTV